MAEDTRWIDLLRKIGFGQELHEPLRTKMIEEGYIYLRADLAAHDAEIVRPVIAVLDRIDALHLRIANPVPNSITVHLCGADRDFFPCPTRRLTAEIRGEMSND